MNETFAPPPLRPSTVDELLLGALTNVHHETERLRSLIGELLAERDRYRSGLMEIFHGEEPRPVGTRYADDGSPSRHDRCTHDRWMYEDCGSCIAEFAGTILRDSDGTATAAACEDMPVPKDCQARPSPKISSSSGESGHDPLD